RNCVLFAARQGTNAMRACFLARVTRVLVASKPYSCGYSLDPDLPIVFSEAAFVAWLLSFCFFDIARHCPLTFALVAPPFAPSLQEFQRCPRFKRKTDFSHWSFEM